MGAFCTGAALNTPGGQNPVFTTTIGGSYFTNWDVDFGNSLTNNGTLTLHEIKAHKLCRYAPTSARFPRPAMDRQGDYYYIENDTAGGHANSYLIGVHPDLLQRSVRLKFRFRLPLTNDPSAKDPNRQPQQWDDIGRPTVVDYSRHDGDGARYKQYSCWTSSLSALRSPTGTGQCLCGRAGQ